MSKESTKSAKVAYLKSKEGRSNVINCFWAIINRNYLPVPNLLADSDVF